MAFSQERGGPMLCEPSGLQLLVWLDLPHVEQDVDGYCVHGEQHRSLRFTLLGPLLHASQNTNIMV